MGLSLRLTQQQPESPVVSRLSANPRIAQPIGQRSRASRGAWSRLGTLAHSDRGVHKATTEGNSSEDAIGPRAEVPVCMLASPLVGFTSTNQCGLGDRTTGLPAHRSSSDTGDLSVQFHSPFRLAGWLAAPYPRLALALPYLIQSPRETEDPMGCPCESWAGSGKCGEMGVGR